MRIKKLVITKCKRFTNIGNINEIIYTPKRTYQLILGTNGSGKSSLLEFLVPFAPRIDTLFHPGGGFSLELTYKDKTYIISSGYESKKHSFKINGEEQNNSGLITRQQELIKEAFNIDPLWRSVVLGHQSFINFSAQQRKDWLTKMDTIDYDFVLEKYKNVLTTLKETKSALKVVMSRFNGLTLPLSKSAREEIDNQEHKLIQEINKYKSILADLSFDNRINLKESISKLDSSNKKLDNIINTLDTKSNKKIKIKRTNNEKEIFALKLQLTELKNTFDKAIKYEELIKTKESGIQEEILNLQNKIVKVGQEINIFGISIDELLDVAPDIKRIINELNEVEYRLSNMEFLEVERDSQELENEINTLVLEIDRMEIKAKEYKNHVVGIKCDNCGNIVGKKQEEELQALVPKIANSKNNLMRLKTRLRVTVKQEQENKKYKMDIETRNALVTDLQITLKISNKISVSLIKEKIVELDNLSLLNEKIKQLIHKQKLDEEAIEEFNKTNGEILNSNILEKRIFEVNDKIVNIESDNKILEEKLKQHDLFREEFNINKELVAKCKNGIYSEVVTAEEERINECIRKLNEELSEVERKITLDDKILMEHTTYKNMVEELKNKLAILTEAERLLSPNTGLIGTTIRQFQTKYINVVNRVIETVWSYDMKVHPCGINKFGKLDYKFPVYINKKKVLDDISDGSRSMKEMIKVGFTVASMEFMNMGTFPLFLDEFGSSMDNAHRQKLFKLLASIKGTHTNIFMVSHFVEFYGGMSTVDVSVINGDNVSYDKTHNKVMSLS